MGRYYNNTGSSGANPLTGTYDDSQSVYDGDGFLTSYTYGDIEYTNITYIDFNGSASEYGGVYKVVYSYDERNILTNETQSVIVNYDSETGRVSSLTIT